MNLSRLMVMFFLLLYSYSIVYANMKAFICRMQVGLSGILMVKGTTYENMDQVPNQEYLYGTLLSENIIGVIHDHFITYYLDMDVDGSDNSFVEVNIKKQETSPGESPRKSYLKAVKKVAKTKSLLHICQLYLKNFTWINNTSKLLIDRIPYNSLNRRDSFHHAKRTTQL